jgi:DNA-binding beta-propeller fold protein YncE
MNTIQNLSTARVAVVLALLVSTVAMRAEPILYATAGAGSTLVKIDVGEGTVTTIGPFGVAHADAIAISPQGKLYTMTEGYPPPGVHPQLAQVNPVTGLATPFGVNLAPEIFMGIGFTPDGQLYGVNAMSGTGDENSLYRFDPNTGEARKVKVTGGCPGIMDLAVHPDGTMYGVNPHALYRINPHTGQATLVTEIQGNGLALMGLAIDDDGNFYVSKIIPNSPLLRVDPQTGATTKLLDTGVDYIHGLEFIPTPRKSFEIDFEKSFVSEGVWDGSVDIDGDGQADGTLHYVDLPGSQVTGNTLHFSGLYAITTPFYSFTAHMQVTLNLQTGLVRGVGMIEEGWLDGAKVHLKGQANLAIGHVEGQFQVTPKDGDDRTGEWDEQED